MPNDKPSPDGGATAEPALRLERLEALVAILERSTLSELSYEDEDIAVTLKRAVASTAPAPAPVPVYAAPAPLAAPLAAPPVPAAPMPPKEDDAEIYVVRSPFVGTFYRSPAPDSAAYTEVGKRVRRGQVVCIIEAMKLMNEIESEVDGTVLEVMVKNGDTVQYGDALFKLRVG
jgi:acetyl-CoA carboxylase biotin carboxyl carrier protein